MRKRITPGVVLGSIAVGFAMSGSAVAGSLITSAKIKDGTIQNKDIKKGTIALNRLTKGAQAAIKRPAGRGQRADGRHGRVRATPPARRGATGADGRRAGLARAGPEDTSGNWGIINRNTTARRPRSCAPAR